MLSDSWYECVRDSEDYLKRFPEVYRPLEGEIRKVLAEMKRVQALLDMQPDWPGDMPPNDPPPPEDGINLDDVPDGPRSMLLDEGPR